MQNDEIFMGVLNDGPFSITDDFFSSDPDSSPISATSTDSSPFSNPDFDIGFSTEGTFFNELGMFGSDLNFQQQVKEESPKCEDTINFSQIISNENDGEPPKKKQKLTGRKRTRDQANIAPNNIISGSFLTNKDQLLSMSSKKLEECVQSLSAVRPLTPEEEKQLKRQRRLIKNRESAQLSRQKKKQYVENLEKQVKTLSSENSNLKTQVNHLSSRNQQLEEQVANLQTYIQQQQQLAKAGSSKIFNKNSTAAAGLCMFVILFSFGLIFSGTPGSPNSVDFPTTVPSVYTGRTLSGYPEIEAGNHIPQLAAKRAREYEEVFPEPKKQKIVAEEHAWIEDDDDELEAEFEYSVPQQVIIPSSDINKSSQSNNSFIYCSEAQRLNPVETPLFSNDGAPVISILLPSGVLNGTIPQIDHMLTDPDNSLLEVSCQILNIEVYPYFPNTEHLSTQSHQLL